MPSGRRIEDYALIGDCGSAALVGRDGSIDWLCLPRFDSGACFAALLGEPRHGRWVIAPVEPAARVERRYLNGSLILATMFETAEGAVELVDFVRPRRRLPQLVRLVRGMRGRVAMSTEWWCGNGPTERPPDKDQWSSSRAHRPCWRGRNPNPR